MFYEMHKYIADKKIVSVPANKTLEDVIELLKQIDEETVVEYKGNYFTKAFLGIEPQTRYLKVYGLYKEQVEELELYNRGLKFIYPERDQLWFNEMKFISKDKIIRILDILEAIEEDPSFEKAITLYKQNPENSTLLKTIQELSKKGTEFLRALYAHEGLEIPNKWMRNVLRIESEAEQFKKNNTVRKPREETIYYETDDEKLFVLIRQAQNRNEPMIYHYQDKDLSTATIHTEDDISIIIRGDTKANLEDKKLKEEALLYIPIRTHKGLAFIKPEKVEEWKICVDAYHKGPNYGKEIVLALKYMAEAESNKEFYFDFLKNYSPEIIQSVIDIIYEYSKKGREYWDARGLNQVVSRNAKAYK